MQVGADPGRDVKMHPLNQPFSNTEHAFDEWYTFSVICNVFHYDKPYAPSTHIQWCKVMKYFYLSRLLE